MAGFVGRRFPSVLAGPGEKIQYYTTNFTNCEEKQKDYQNFFSGVGKLKNQKLLVASGMRM